MTQKVTKITCLQTKYKSTANLKWELKMEISLFNLNKVYL